MNVNVNILQSNQNGNEVIGKLPSPFAASSRSSQNSISTVNHIEASGHLQGYRSRFNIHAMKQQYAQQQQQHQPQQPSAFQQPATNKPSNYVQSNHPQQRNGQYKAFNNQQNVNRQPVTQQSSSFWCELCERGFRTLQMLERHVDEHEKCYFDGCKYEAHTSLVQKHIEMQHNTGLFQQINSTETEEDIEKWRAERRKRYPTKNNIELRQKAQEERMKRGERLEVSKKRFGKPNERRPMQTNSNVNKERAAVNRKSRKRTRKRNNKKTNEIENANSGEKDPGPNAVRCFKGIPNAMATVDRTITEPSDVNEGKPNALSALCMYSSDSDADNIDEGDDAHIQEPETDTADEAIVLVEQTLSNTVKLEEEEVNRDNKPKTLQSAAIENTIEIVPQNLNSHSTLETNAPDAGIVADISVPNNDSDDEAPEEQPIAHESDFHPTETTDDRPQTASRSSNLKRSSAAMAETVITDSQKSKKPTLLDLSKRYRRQNTLLEKLLEKDIRHERNVLLQCVRYVVANNFFGVGSSEKEQ